MLNVKYFILKLLISGFCGISIAFADSQPVDILPVPELINSLQSGGHIIYMRHTTTNHMQKDKDRENLEDCAKQRNLSVVGRDQAQKIGSALKALRIPIGNVSSSPYCRCKDTAKLVFNQFNIDPDLAFSINRNKREAKQLGEHLYSAMLSAETGKNNTVFVGHTSNLRDGLGIWPKPEGAAVVFQKRGNGLVYKGIIKPNEWPEH